MAYEGNQYSYYQNIQLDADGALIVSVDGNNSNQSYQRLKYPIGITTGSLYDNTIFRSLREHVATGTVNITLPALTGQFVYYQLENQLNITTIRLNISTAVAASTMAIGIYSMSIYTYTDGVKYYYPSTLRYTITNNLNTSTTGLKTITGLNFIVDNTLTEENLWCIVYLPTASIGLTAWNSSSSLVRGGDFGIYAIGGGISTSINTSQQISLSTSTLPTSFSGITTQNPNFQPEPWLLTVYTLP